MRIDPRTSANEAIKKIGTDRLRFSGTVLVFDDNWTPEFAGKKEGYKCDLIPLWRQWESNPRPLQCHCSALAS